MKKNLLFLFCLIICLSLRAQTYQEKAADIQKVVWGGASAEFAIKDVPEQYRNESAVIIAQSYSTQRSSNSKFKFMIITAAVANRTSKVSTFHERVKIYDKTALEKYSTLEYQKTLDQSSRIFFAKFNNVHETYVGAKIIKANGKEIVVNTSEEVLLKNTEKDKKGKLAIPDLQVGDILDYYVSTNDVSEVNDQTVTNNDQLFMLVAEYPVLNFSLDVQLNRKTRLYYISANGAPKFEESTLANGDQLYVLKIKDLPKYQSELWTSKYRQYPYIEVSNSFKVEGNDRTAVSGVGERFKLMKTGFEKQFNEVYRRIDDEPESMLKAYFDGKKGMKNAPLDSTMKVLYNIWRYLVFGSYNKEYLEDMSKVNGRTVLNKSASINMSMLLTRMKIPHEVILVANRMGNTLDNVFNYEDFNAMIRIDNGDKPLYMCFDDVFTRFNEIPEAYQGEKAVTLRSVRKGAQNYVFTEGETTLPIVGADKNLIDEQLQVSLLADNLQKVKIERSVIQTGSMRSSDQPFFVSAMEVDKSIMDAVKGDPLSKRLAKNTDTKKVSEAFVTGMAKTPAEVKKNFSDEIKGKFEQDPQQISNYKIINTGLDDAKPDFEYTSTFVLDNLVKKAGGNYIIDVGKMTGGFLHVEEKNRKRSVDVYMPAARTFKYEINIAIPMGYTANGVEELNFQKANKTGSFSSVAKINGNMLNIVITRIYSNNFEKVAEWPALLELIDTASGFDAKKILLEKKG